MINEQEIENKTIVVSYDDVSRMRDFCCEEGVGVTRDFMDWYINDNAFFSKTGILIIENIFKDSEMKYCLSFDFNNPDIAIFSLYDYETQKSISKFRFIREGNLTMSHITILLNYWDKKYFIKNKETLFSFTEPKSNTKEKTEKEKLEINSKKTSEVLISSKKSINTNYWHGYREAQLKNRDRLLKEYDELIKKLCIVICRQGIYYCYATMYYFAKNKAKEITGIPKQELLQNGVGKQITATYKYTGYVNIDEAKIYKPIIKKDPNEPIREYGRHIEKWSVRGHYRRVSGKVIWIDAFEKGSGELEKRIYGTENESEVNLIPKVFEVTRTVFEETENKSIIKESKINPPIFKQNEPAIVPKIKLITKREDGFLNKITKIWKNFISMFKTEKK